MTKKQKRKSVREQRDMTKEKNEKKGGRKEIKNRGKEGAKKGGQNEACLRLLLQN